MKIKMEVKSKNKFFEEGAEFFRKYNGLIDRANKMLDDLDPFMNLMTDLLKSEEYLNQFKEALGIYDEEDW